MNVVVRVDASRVIGSGHVMRSLTLARSLNEARVDLLFITRQHEGNLIELIRRQRFPVVTLPPPQQDIARLGCPSHASWIGASWEDDARDTRAAIDALQTRPDWLIVDHYGLDERWEAALRPSVERIFVIDDLADRRHDCDLLLDQNLVENMDARYEGKVTANCASMLGPRYALLHPDFADLRERIAPREGPIRRILIFFGGADQGNLSSLALRAFQNLERPDIEVDVVVGGNNANAGTLHELAEGHANIRIHTALPSLATVMARADIAIGAPGSTSWERLSLGLPALLVTLAKNQQALAEALQSRGMATWLGSQDEVDLARLQKALATLIERGCDTAGSRICRMAVDGKGTRRVSAALLLNSRTELFVRHANLSDEELLLEWANNPITRRNSFTSARISAEEHRRWFFSRLRDVDNCVIFIVETSDGVALGTVRFERWKNSWKAHYSVAEPYRGKGLGRRIMELCLKRLAANREKLPVVGLVAAANLPSHRVFRSLGFTASSDADGIVEYRRPL